MGNWFGSEFIFKQKFYAKYFGALVKNFKYWITSVLIIRLQLSLYFNPKFTPTIQLVSLIKNIEHTLQCPKMPTAACRMTYSYFTYTHIYTLIKQVSSKIYFLREILIKLHFNSRRIYRIAWESGGQKGKLWNRLLAQVNESEASTGLQLCLSLSLSVFSVYRDCPAGKYILATKSKLK